MPLGADESCHDRGTLDELRGKYQVVNIKLDKTGGLTEALRLKADAEDAGFRMMIGCMLASSLAMARAWCWRRGPIWSIWTGRCCWPRTAVPDRDTRAKPSFRRRPSYGGKQGTVTRGDLERRIDQAMGRTKADLVIKNTRFLNVVTGEIAEGDIAVCGDIIVGTYESYDGDTVIDGREKIAVPEFIDTHVHCESTLVSPFEFDRCVLPRGTTTAICDPHEICNVLGEEGLQYFLDSSVGLAMDLRVQLSSCVPATELETSGARLEAADLVRHRNHPQVIGLAEFMNFPGVLHKDPRVLDKLAAFQGGHIDGHSPLVSGYDLNAYLSCGIKNCHETTGVEEAREKLRKGMQVLIRDGSVSKDVNTLAPIIDA